MRNRLFEWCDALEISEDPAEESMNEFAELPDLAFDDEEPTREIILPTPSAARSENVPVEEREGFEAPTKEWRQS